MTTKKILTFYFKLCFKPKLDSNFFSLRSLFLFGCCYSIISSRTQQEPKPNFSLSPSDVQNSIHQNIYGKSLAITSTEAQLSTTIIENPEMLKYQQERQNSAQANSGPGSTGAESSAPKLNSVMNGESLEDIRKVGKLKCNIQQATQRV